MCAVHELHPPLKFIQLNTRKQHEEKVARKEIYYKWKSSALACLPGELES